MKKLFLTIMIGLSAIIIWSCTSSSSNETALWGNLVSYTEKGENEEILLGVKAKYGKTGEADQIIITPDRYTSITADEYFIICRRNDIEINVFNHDGSPFGNGVFDTFTSMPIGKGYLGTKYKTRTFYFPEQKHIVITKTSLTTLREVLMLLDSGEWEIRNYDGDLLWKTPKLRAEETLWIIKNNSRHYIAIEKSKGACTIYDVNGKELKTKTTAQWRTSKTKLTAQKEFVKGHNYAEYSGKIEEL